MIKRAGMTSVIAAAMLAACASAPDGQSEALSRQVIVPERVTWTPDFERCGVGGRDPLEDRIVVTGTPIAGEAAAARPAFSPPPPAPPPRAMMRARADPPPAIWRGYVDREDYRDVDANPVVSVADEAVSTFSIDVDTASYAVIRRDLRDCRLPPTDAVRIEEVVNYFDYAYPLPDGLDAPFAASVTVTDTPWNAGTQLMHIGIQGYDVTPEERPRANLVFLMDVSGSMRGRDRLPLAIASLRMLLDQLDEDDTVSIVVYASATGVVLEPTPASDRDTIEAALNRLQAGGSTAGGAGLALAYSLAERNFDPDGVNRVILATDGDFNVGVTRDERLEDFISRKRESGVYLSIMGFGRGNYNDALMQTLAQAGNGSAAYIDTLGEARRLLVNEASSTLFPIANDVENPGRVQSRPHRGIPPDRL